MVGRLLTTANMRSLAGSIPTGEPPPPLDPAVLPPGATESIHGAVMVLAAMGSMSLSARHGAQLRWPGAPVYQHAVAGHIRRMITLDAVDVSGVAVNGHAGSDGLDEVDRKLRPCAMARFDTQLPPAMNMSERKLLMRLLNAMTPHGQLPLTPHALRPAGFANYVVPAKMLSMADRPG